MRILHSADWHIGRRFHNVSLLDDQATVLDEFVALARDAAPDAIVLAGDIYDRADPAADAVRLLDDTLDRLVSDVGAPTLVIAGNHDNGDRLGFGSRLLADRGLYIAGRFRPPASPVTLVDQHGPVHFHLVPYADPPTIRDVLADPGIHGHEAAAAATLAQIRAQTPFRADQRNVLVFHGFVTGGQASDSERPLTVGGAGQVAAEVFDGFCYVALGHLHRPQRIGDDRIRYAGSLMKYSFSEADHVKSLSLVEIDSAGDVAVEEIRLQPPRDLRILEGTLDEILANAGADSQRNDYLLVRLTDAAPRLDAMARIRAGYPNVLHLERPVLLARLQRETAEPQQMRERGILELFEHFYEERREAPLSEDQRAVLAALIDELARQEREA